jgi:tetratricopeptide (TPR) repeat protein
MIKNVLYFLFFISSSAWGQFNCNVYKLDNNEACYQACLLVTEAENMQGSGQSQFQFDAALGLCPTMDYAYREKSVPYLKRGDFITWKKFIDKAVELNPKQYLGVRGWCRYQFVRDYKGAIEDLEKLDSMVSYNIGYTVNGDYHLTIAKALCYKAIGEKNKAIKIIEEQLAQSNYSPGIYDYLHLGVAKIENGDLEGGVAYLKKQIAYNDYLAEPYYYMALVFKQQNRTGECKQYLEKAKAFYLKGYKMSDPYTQPMDKIFLADIDRELKSIQ